MRFEFATSARIVFGAGTSAELPALVRPFGLRPFVVTGRDVNRVQPMVEAIAAAGLRPTVFSTPGEPTVAVVEDGVARARAADCDLVVAIGGGSAIDAGKAIAALLTNPGEALDYLEVVGRGRPLALAPLPLIAVPTTAGTGSEVTRNAVLGVPDRGVKVSLRSLLMLPRLALVDPELTASMPVAVAASTGLDALTQLIEPFVSTRATPMTDALCIDGLRAAAGALPYAGQSGPDAARHRASMSYASLLGGMALANAGLGVVHGLAAPIGGRFDAPHGAVCAALLAPGMAANLTASSTAGTDSSARYATIARVLTGRGDATASDGVEWVRSVVDALGIPRLSAYGIGRSDLAGLADAASRTSSMSANPFRLSTDVLVTLLESAL